MEDAVTGQPGGGNSYGIIQDSELTRANANPSYVIPHMLQLQMDTTQVNKTIVWPLIVADGSVNFTGPLAQGLTLMIPASTPRPANMTRGQALLFDTLQQFGGLIYNFGYTGGGLNIQIYSTASQNSNLLNDLVNNWTWVIQYLGILTNQTGPSSAKGMVNGTRSDAFPAPPPLDLKPTGGIEVSSSTVGAYWPTTTAPYSTGFTNPAPPSSGLTPTAGNPVTGVMPFSGSITRPGGPTPTNAQVGQIEAGPFIFAVNGVGDTGTSSNPASWSSPLYTDITGVGNVGAETGYPGPPAGGRAGTSPFNYLLDTNLGHNVWDTYRILPAGQPMYDALFAVGTGTGGGGGGGGGLSGTPHSPLPSGYFHVVGNQIVSGTGVNVKLACEGYITGSASTYMADFATMRAQGFNCARVNWYDATDCPNGTCIFNTTTPSGESWDAMVTAATANNMKLVINHHGNEGVEGNAGCHAAQYNGLWYDVPSNTPVSGIVWNVPNGTDGCGTTGTVTYATYRANWLQWATHYAGNSTVVAFDLHNEPNESGVTDTIRTNWGGNNGADILAMTNDVGAAIEAIDPGVLIIAEGIITPWNFTFCNGQTGATMGFTGGSVQELTCVGTKPVTCCAGEVIYSPHEYATSGSGLAPDSGPAFATSRTAAWGYIEAQNLAPVWIGEMGANMDNSDGQLPDQQGWATAISNYLNGLSGANGGPTFTGCAQPMGMDWYQFGYNPGQIIDGTLNADGSNKTGQYNVYSGLEYTTCTSTGGGGGTGTTVQAQRVADMLNIVSLDVGISGGGAPYINSAGMLADAQYLGVTRMRDGLNISLSGASGTTFTNLVTHGISFSAEMPYPPNTQSASAQITQAHAWQAISPNAIFALEGINEPGLFYPTANYGSSGYSSNSTCTGSGGYGGGGCTWLPVAQYTRDTVTAFLADAALKSLQIYAPSKVGQETDNVGMQWLTIPIGSGLTMADGTNYGQFLNDHVYPQDQQFLHSPGILGACQPNDSAAGNAFAIEMQWDHVTTYNSNFSGYGSLALAEVNPHVVTEFGYHTSAAGTTNLNEDKKSRCIITGIPVAFKFGEQLLSIYNMYDLTGGGFGLMSGTGAPLQSGTWLHNFTTALTDTGTTARTFTTGSLTYSLSNLPATGETLLLQKSNGDFDLLIWDDASNWNFGTQSPITVGPTNVTVTLGNGLIATMTNYDVASGTAPTQTITANSITVPVADYPQIVNVHVAGSQVGSTTWNPADLSGITLSNTNFTATSPAAGSSSVRSTTSQTTGKFCFDVTATAITSNWSVGLANSAFVLNVGGGLGVDTNGIGIDPNSTGGLQGIFYGNSRLAAGASASPSGEAQTICADLANRLFWASNATQRAAGTPWNNSATANPATGAGGLSFSGISGPYFIIFNEDDPGGVATLNAAGPLTITLPSGFTTWQAPVVTTGGGRPFILILGANDNVPWYGNDNSPAPISFIIN
jgi:endoglucanase/chitinase